MKKIYHIGMVIAVVLLIAGGCSKDLGNYDYKPVEQISVAGLGESYKKISLRDRLTIDPVVTSTENDADFEYFWGIYLDKTKPLDTISKTKKLDYLIKEDAGIWTLVFCIKNKKTGLSKYSNAVLNIETPFTRGWYVSKDDGNKTDVDLFSTPNSIIAEEKIENVFSLVNGYKLDGKAALLNYFSSYKSPLVLNANGTLQNVKVLFVTSSKDASVAYINNFKEFNNFDGLFYSPPTTKAPQLIATNNQYNSFVNDGQLYFNFYMGGNTGRYGVKLMKDVADSPYKLSKYFMSFYTEKSYFFDDMSSTFYCLPNGGNTLGVITAASGSLIPVKNNNKKVLFMGCKTSLSPFIGYALFQDKTNTALKTLCTINASVTAFNITANETLNITDKLYDAEHFALLQDDENLLYFSRGKEVWSRNLNNKAESLQFTVPLDEEITFIRHRKYTATGLEVPYSYNYVMIGTKIGTQYKVRMFTKTSGNLDAKPAFILEGTGSAGDVIYISPLMNSGTYPSTY